MLAGLAESRSHAGDAADVLGTGALAALLRAALDEVRQENALARVQKADAFGPWNLWAERESMSMFCSRTLMGR